MNESDLLQKGWVFRNGEWFAPRRLPLPAKHQPDSHPEPLAKNERTIADPVRRSVCIESYRAVLVDRDGVWVKYLVDALQYAGIIFNDSTKWLDLEIKQIKVEHKHQERTEVIIK